MSEGIKIGVRVRPFMPKEIEQKQTCCVTMVSDHILYLSLIFPIHSESHLFHQLLRFVRALAKINLHFISID